MRLLSNESENVLRKCIEELQEQGKLSWKAGIVIAGLFNTYRNKDKAEFSLQKIESSFGIKKSSWRVYTSLLFSAVADKGHLFEQTTRKGEATIIRVKDKQHKKVEQNEQKNSNPLEPTKAVVYKGKTFEQWVEELLPVQESYQLSFQLCAKTSPESAKKLMFDRDDWRCVIKSYVNQSYSVAELSQIIMFEVNSKYELAAADSRFRGVIRYTTAKHIFSDKNWEAKQNQYWDYAKRKGGKLELLSKLHPDKIERRVFTYMYEAVKTGDFDPQNPEQHKDLISYWRTKAESIV